MTHNTARKKRKRQYRQPQDVPLFDWETMMRDVLGAFIGEIKRPVQASIPPEMFRKLLMLCHPDKHGNSATATEVTKWLLEQRGKT